MITKTQYAIQNSAHLPEYQEYFAQEHELLKKIVQGKLLDVGCGECRPLPHIHELITHYYGFDRDEKMLAHVQKNLPAELKKKVTLIPGDANQLSSYIKNPVDTTICLWNTIAVMSDNQEGYLLQEMGKVTMGDIFIALAPKTEKAFSIRKRYYETMNIEHHINATTHTITSEVWGASKAYHFSDLERIGKEAKLILKDAGIIGDLGIYGMYGKR